MEEGEPDAEQIIIPLKRWLTTPEWDLIMRQEK